MKKAINKTVDLFLHGNIRASLDYGITTNFVDIIHNNGQQIHINKTCSEYLFKSDVGKHAIIIPIPISKCFKDIEDFNVKKVKILEYIDYLNQSDLINFEFLKQEDEISIMDQYFKESLIGNITIPQLEYCISNNIKVDDTFNCFIDNDTNISKISNKNFEKVKLHLNKIISTEFSNLLSINKKEDHLVLNITNINNKSCQGWGSSYTNHLNLIDSSNSYISTLNSIKRVQNVTYNESFHKRIKKDEFFDKSDLNIKLKPNLQLDSLEFNSFILRLKIEYNKKLSELIKSKDSKIYEEQCKFYEFAYAYKNGTLNLSDKTPILDAIRDKAYNQFMFVKVNGRKLKIKNNRKLLFHVTLLRYLFFYRFDHIADIIMKFKDDYDISILKNLFISSNFHNNTAWHRFNLVNCKNEYHLGTNIIKGLTYYKYPGDKYINTCLTQKGDISLNGIFSPDEFNYDYGKKKCIRVYNRLNRLLKANNFSEIEKVFDQELVKKPKKTAQGDVYSRLFSEDTSELMEDQPTVRRVARNTTQKRRSVKRSKKQVKQNYFISTFGRSDNRYKHNY